MPIINAIRYVSRCCLWEAKQHLDADGTPAHWICEKCAKPCDLIEAMKKQEEPSGGDWGEDV